MAQEINNYKFELSYKEINGQSINFGFMRFLIIPFLFIYNFLHENLGFWTRNNCFDEVVKLFYESIKQNLDDIIKISTDIYKEFTNNLKDYIIQSKETSSKITLLHLNLNNYETKKYRIY